MIASLLARHGRLAALVAVALFTNVIAHAQEPSEELSIDSLSERIRRVESAADIDAALKTRLLDTYRKAVDELRAADSWLAKKRVASALGGEAPARIVEIRDELSRPATPAAVPAELSVRDLEVLLQKNEARLAAATKERADVEHERRTASARRVQLPKMMAAARMRIDEADRAIKADPTPREPGDLADARHLLLMATKRAATAELSCYEEEAAVGETAGLLLAARVDLAESSVATAKRLVGVLRDRVGKEKRGRARAAVQEAQRAVDSLQSAPETIRRIAAENLSMAAERVEPGGVLSATVELAAELQTVRDTLLRVQKDFAAVQAKVEVLGLVETTGLLLRRERIRLPETGTYAQRMDAREGEMGRMQLRLVELEDERSGLSDLEARARLAAGPVLDEAQPSPLAEHSRELVEARRALIETLAAEYGAYFYQLVELNVAQRQLIASVEDFASYIDERVLWIRSASVLRPGDVVDSLRGAKWFIGGAQWRSVVRAIATEPAANAVAIGLAALLLAILLFERTRLTRRLEALAKNDPSESGFTGPLWALVLTVLIAMPLPTFLAVSAWRLGACAVGAEFASAMASALKTIAVVLFTIEFLRQMCIQKGLAEAHFRWSAASLAFARKNLFIMAIPVIPLVFLFAATEAQSNELIKSSFGRMIFIAWMIVFSFFGHRLLSPRSPLLNKQLGQVQEGWLFRLRHVWHAFAVGAPLILAVLATLGYYYAASRLALSLMAQLWVLLGVMTIEAISFRWVFLARRMLALRRVRAREATRAAAELAADEGAPAGLPPEAEIPINKIGVQSQRFVRYVAAFALLLSVWAIWADVLPALGILRRVALWSSGEGTVSLVDVFVGVAILVAMTLAATNVPGLLEIVILQRLPFDKGARYAIAAIARYTITVTGIVLALGAIGVSWSSVQWLVAAMTVGLGFGLQEIFANFVSGIIILFERPVRIGDVVTVGGVHGVVSRIRIRATTITDWDRKELIVPNKEFITGQLVNWSLSDKILRIIVPVGIAYGSDTELAHKTLMDVARANEHVLSDPPPSALFLGFGESSLNFELRVFIENITHYLSATDTLHMQVDQAFRKAGIEIAFPQRDIHVRSVQQAIPFEHVAGAPPAAADR